MPRSSASRHRAAAMFALVILAVYYVARARLVGPYVDADALRDLLAALDLAHGGMPPAFGPAVAGSPLQLGPAYIYFLALPLWLWSDVRAVPWWVALWQIATVLLLFDTVRRFFSIRIALLAVGIFYFSDVCFSLERPFTHSDLNPLLGLLVFRSLVATQNGAPWAFCGAAFWTSLAFHFHLLDLALLPVILALLVVAKPPLRGSHVAAAGVAALVPFLPTVDPHASAEMSAAAWSGAIPLGVALVAAWQRPALRSVWTVWLVSLLASWAFLVFALGLGNVDGQPAFRLFNIVVPLDLLSRHGSVAGADGGAWERLAGALPLPANLATLVFAMGGIALCAGVTSRAWRRDPEARRSPSVSLLLWTAMTAAAAGLACVVARPERRYLTVAWTPLAISAAIGLDAAWRRGVARLGDRRSLSPPALRRVLIGGAVAAAAVIALLLGERFAALSGALTDPASYAGASRALAALRSRADDSGLLRRVHGALDSQSAFLDRQGPMLFLLQFPADQQPRSAGDEHYLLIDSAEAASPRIELLSLGVGPVAAVAVRPALSRTATVDGQPTALPYRFLQPLPAEPEQRATPRLLPAGAAPGPLRLSLSRKVPRDPTLRAVEVLLSDVDGRRPRECAVTLHADGAAVPVQSLTGTETARWRFLLPASAAPQRIEIGVASCRVGYIDVYDVYARPSGVAGERMSRSSGQRRSG